MSRGGYFDIVIALAWMLSRASLNTCHEAMPFTDLVSAEYCQWETFNATCDPDHVILMHSALYGRMKFGRCMREDHGSTGCRADVLPILDRLCSGRRGCRLAIPDATLHSVHQCPKELMPYLEAGYTCVSVKSGSIQACALFGGQPLPPDRGYLASITSAETGVGLVNCPWMIEAQAGQRVNMTLFTFSVSSDDPPDPLGTLPGVPGVPSSPAGGPKGPSCPWTIVVREGNLTVQLPGCAEFSREKLVYTSHGSSVHVHLSQTAPFAAQGTADGSYLPSSSSSSLQPILLRYQVFGCADMTPVSGGVMRRHGDTTIVRCSTNGPTFIFTCVDDHWRGEMSNCTKASAVESGHKELKNGGVHYGLLLVIGVGVLVGLLLGISMLFAILHCLRRQRWKRTRRSQTADPLFQRVEFDDAGSSVYLDHRQHTSSTSCSSFPSSHGLCPYHLHHHRHHHHPFSSSPSDLDAAVFSTLLSMPEHPSSFEGGTPPAAANPHATPSLRYQGDDGARPTSSPLDGATADDADVRGATSHVTTTSPAPAPLPPHPSLCLEDAKYDLVSPPPPPPPSSVLLDLLRDSLVPALGANGVASTRQPHPALEYPPETLRLGPEP